MLARLPRIFHLAFAVLFIAALAGIPRFINSQKPGAHAPTNERPGASYIDSAICASCHAEIAKTYKLTGMARSLYQPTPSNTIEDYQTHNRIYSRISDRHFTMTRRDGHFFQKRNQIGFGGKETNVVERRVDYVMGSGNHVRSYLSRAPEGELVELPVSWYTEQGGYWAPSPGYDRPNPEDFRRTIVSQCLFCHNGYPPLSRDPLPEGIDCQRCHGPGSAHVTAAQSPHATHDSLRRSIVNPARLNRDRQLETCFQCHLEPTSRPLPSVIGRYDRVTPFSYRPGELLSDSFIYFDRGSQAHPDDNFEIAHAAYRLRKSRCFRASQMTCTTCHNPHLPLRAEEAKQHYAAACKTCHAFAHASASEKATHDANCVECHMPKRRTDDVVHAVMTDHYIVRDKPSGDLLAPSQELHHAKQDIYRGEVVLYYPPQLPATPDNELLQDVAQVHDGANMDAGIPRLRRDLEKYAPAAPEFYFELAEAYAKTGNQEEAIDWYYRALAKRPDFRLGSEELAVRLLATGRQASAVEVLEKAAIGAPDAVVLTDLGGAYLRQGDLARAEPTLRHALKINPDLPEAHNLLGLLLGQKEDWRNAEAQLREAIAIQPELPEANFNLANLLSRAGDYEQAQFYFEKAIAARPSYAEAHHNFGLLLVLKRSYDKSESQLREASRLAPNNAEIHTDLGEVLAVTGKFTDAAEEFQRAIALNSEDYKAHLDLGNILSREGRTAEAAMHFEKAAASQDPDVRNAALIKLKSR